MANVAEVARAYVTIIPSMKGAQQTISDELVPATETACKKAGSNGGKIFLSSLSAAAKFSAKAIAAYIATATTAIISLGKSALDAYAENEQLVGGVRKLYETEEAANLVLSNAAQAYKTAGMSANDYMKSVTGISAALLASGISADEAAAAADQAMRDISDNANTFGTKTAEELTNVYTALARGNYTLIDNLSLGFAGSAAGMQKLIDKANALKVAQGKAGDLVLGNMADMVEAIHLVQEAMNIAGTTEKEAAETIQGSLVMLGAAWENFKEGLGDPEGDVEALLQTVLDAFETVVKNVAPTVERVAKAVSENAPQICAAVGSVLEELKPFFNETLPKIVSYVGEILLTPENVNTMINVGLQFGAAILKGINSRLGVLGNLGNQVVDNVLYNMGAIDTTKPSESSDYLVGGYNSSGNALYVKKGTNMAEGVTIGTINITADSTSTASGLVAQFRRAANMA